MIFKAAKLIGKASTVIWVAKNGMKAYKIGKETYKSYKKVNQVKNGASDIFREVSKVVKKKP